MRHQLAAVLATAALALTACTAADTDSTTADKPTTASSQPASSTPKHSSAENAFLITTRAKIPALKKVPDDQILDLGHSSCDAIDAGNSPAAVAAKAEEGLQIGDANSGYIVGAAVAQFCPKHKSEL